MQPKGSSFHKLTILVVLSKPDPALSRPYSKSRGIALRISAMKSESEFLVGKVDGLFKPKLSS
jgi:hypothetical protein